MEALSSCVRVTTIGNETRCLLKLMSDSHVTQSLFFVEHGRCIVSIPVKCRCDQEPMEMTLRALDVLQ